MNTTAPDFRSSWHEYDYEIPQNVDTIQITLCRGIIEIEESSVGNY